MMIRLEIDLFNHKKLKKLETENMIMEKQLINWRNELLEFRRRADLNEPSRTSTTDNK